MTTLPVGDRVFAIAALCVLWHYASVPWGYFVLLLGVAWTINAVVYGCKVTHLWKEKKEL